MQPLLPKYPGCLMLFFKLYVAVLSLTFEAYLLFATLCIILLMEQIEDWRDIAQPRDFLKTQRVRLLGENAVATGFGNGYEALNSNDAVSNPR